MNLDDLKLLLGVEGNEQDAILAEKLAAAIDYAENYCNRKFDEFPNGVKLGIKALIEATDNPVNVHSESVGGELSQSFFSTDQTAAANAYFKPYRKVKFL